MSNDGEMVPLLGFVFNSEFFKDSMYKKVKNPCELIAGTLKLTGMIMPKQGEEVGKLYGIGSVMGLH